jgi:hypothetical protein
MNAMDIGSQGVAQPHPWQQFGNSHIRPVRPMRPRNLTIRTIRTPLDTPTRRAHGSGPCLRNQVEVRVLSTTHSHPHSHPYSGNVIKLPNILELASQAGGQGLDLVIVIQRLPRGLLRGIDLSLPLPTNKQVPTSAAQGQRRACRCEQHEVESDRPAPTSERRSTPRQRTGEPIRLCVVLQQLGSFPAWGMALTTRARGSHRSIPHCAEK